MKALIRRVSSASVEIGGRTTGPVTIILDARK